VDRSCRDIFKNYTLLSSTITPAQVSILAQKSKNEVALMTTQRFSTHIKEFGAKILIGIPFNPDDVWGVKPRHYVSGFVNEHSIRAVIDTDGARFFISLGAAWRRDNQLDSGASVKVVLAPEDPQSDQLAEDFTSALAAELQAKAFFDGLATYYRKNYLRWIDSAKRPKTRAARIEKVVQLLKAGMKQ
jgi:hypothetical protein